MKNSWVPVTLVIGLGLSIGASAQQNEADSEQDRVPVKSLGMVTVFSSRPSSLPTQIPTTIESVTSKEIAQTVNATDAQDAIKYFPSLVVRRRYIGDYNHAVLSSRASGTGNSARSAVYADGILLSNYLGNGATYAPRWGLVTPEEIERVEVMYGPFSAAYPGNSAGAIVDYLTRMPTQLEGHVKLGLSQQKFDLYNTHETDSGGQISASLGSKSGDWSYWINLNHTDSQGQPLVIASQLKSATRATYPIGVANGAMDSLNYKNDPVYLLGTSTQYHTVQDHAKVKLAYEVTPEIRASYVLGNWQNTSDGKPQSYLTDASGTTVYSGKYTLNGENTFDLKGLFNASKDTLDHWMHGVSVKSHTKGTWDWEVAATMVDYKTDLSRSSTVNNANNLLGTMTTGTYANAASLTDQKGTGWSNFAAKGIWRPAGMRGEHIVDFGFQQDNYKLRIKKTNFASTDNWLSGTPADTLASLALDVGGKSQTQSFYGQDAWAFAPGWKTVLGARVESWNASEGYATSLRTPGNSSTVATDTYDARSEIYTSPKAALAYQLSDDLVLKGSVGRAVRMPTVSELYGATSKCSDIATRILSDACPAGQTWVNSPTLRPEKSWTSEITLQKTLDSGQFRVTFFNEDVTDSLYSQAVGLKSDATPVNMVQNIDKVSTQGLELAFQGDDVITKGLDFSGSVTYADSRIRANSSYVLVPGDTIDKQQPRVPLWRATALANYHWDERLSTALGIRYSSDQFSTLNNIDVNGFAYTAASRFLVFDVRMQYVINQKLAFSAGIDNLTNQEYWNYHPYPGRTFFAELKYDL